jgi:lipoyl(octanoyl) transferase
MAPWSVLCMSERAWRVELGRQDYRETWAIQRRLVEERQAGLIPDVLILVEHPPTYTLGRSGKPEHLLVDEARLASMGAVFVETDRGGDITFHGPGQVVGYPIVDLHGFGRDVHRYLRDLEEVILLALRSFGISGRREAGLTGVWHDRGKLAAIGVRVSRWVTSHGFALNVSTDLDYFKQIVPCGIVNRGVSSMEDVLLRPVAVDRVRDELARGFASVFSREMEPVPAADFMAHLHVHVH